MKKSKIVVIILSIIILLLSVYSVIATKAVADSITDYNELYEDYQALSKKYRKYESDDTSYKNVIPPSLPKTSNNLSSRDVEDLSMGESIVLFIVLSPFVIFVMMCSTNTKKKRRRKMCGPGGY